MRLSEIRNGMRLTLFSGRRAERRPKIVTVLMLKDVQSDSKTRRWQTKVLVKPCSGGKRELVLPRQLQPASVYDDFYKRADVTEQRARQLQKHRLLLHETLIRRNIIPQSTEFVRGGQAFRLEINSRSIEKLINILRGHDGTDEENEGSEVDNYRHGVEVEEVGIRRQGIEVTGVGTESLYREARTSSELPCEVRDVAATG